MAIERLKSFFQASKKITVEPLVFINFLALSSLAVSEHTLFYKTVCIQNFEQTVEVDCDNLRKNPDAEDRVQKVASTWTIFLSLSYVLPAILAENFLGAFGDMYGRKFNILLGFCGLILTTVPDFFLILYPHTPLYIMAICNVFVGFSGYAASIMISCMAFLADTVKDERDLTFRMTIVSMCKSLGALCGAFAMGACTKYLSLATSILLSQSVLVLGFFYALCRIPDTRPGRPKNGPVPNTVAKLAEVPTEKPKITCKSVSNFFKEIMKMNQEVAKTIFKKRRYHKRAYLLLCTCTFFCYTMSELGLQHGPLMSLYAFRRPFNWSASELGTYKGVQHTFALTGNLLGAIVIKKFQNKKFQVTNVILVALASGFGFLLLTGLSKTGYVLYIASAVGAFSTLLVPAMKSFIARQVDPDEVGKALAVNGIAADLAFVLTTLVFTNIYNATLSAFAGFVFVLGSVIVAACFCGMAWMHFDILKQDRRIDQSRASCQAATFNVITASDDGSKCFT